MRRVVALFVFAGLTLACGSAPPSTGGGGGPAPGTTDDLTFRVTTPELTIQPGQEKTFCYYTRLPNPQRFGVRRFESTMTPGSHHLIVFTLKEATRPEGTVEECGFPRSSNGFGGSRVIPVWLYAAQSPEAAIELPAGVGMTVEADQHVVVQMHYLNASTEVLRPQATVRMIRHTTDDYVRAAPFVTYDTRINVPAGQEGEARARCETPPGATFFLASTHSHRFTTRARVLDGDRVVVDTADWEHPRVEAWMGAPYQVFSSGALTAHCTYKNTTGTRLQTGDSALTDEMCMGVGYFFPAPTGGRFCINGSVFPL